MKRFSQKETLNIDDSNGEIDKIKDSFVIIGGPSTVVDLQTDAQRYLDIWQKNLQADRRF